MNISLQCILYYLSIYLFNANSESPESSRKPNVTTIAIEDSPYNAQLYIGRLDDQSHATYCPGTIIGSKWIITSSRCGVGDASLMKVFVGSNELFKGLRYDVEKMTTMENDEHIGTFHPYPMLMIVELKLDLEMGIGVMAVNLGGRSEENLFDGNVGNLTGFGDVIVDRHLAVQRSLLHNLEVPIYRHQTCVINYQGHAFPRATDICVHYLVEPMREAKTPCIGEHGMPLVMNFKLVGIASSINHCGSSTAPTLFVSIPASRDWICNITGL